MYTLARRLHVPSPPRPLRDQINALKRYVSGLQRFKKTGERIYQFWWYSGGSVYLIASQMQMASIEWLLGRYTNIGGD